MATRTAPIARTRRLWSAGLFALLLLWFAPAASAQGTLALGNNVLGGSGMIDNIAITDAILIASDPTITTTPGHTQTMSGVISGSGSVEVNGGGTVILSGANTYTGGTTICGTACGAAGGSSTVQVINSNPGTSSSIGTGSLTFDGGTLQAGATGLTLSNSGVFINTTGAAIDSNGKTLTLSGLIENGTGAPGTLAIVSSVAGGTVTLTNDANLFTGATAIKSGTLALSGGGSLAQSSGVAVASGATFDISGNGPGPTGIQTLSGAGTVQTGASGGLVLTNASTTSSGNITGGGGLEVAGGTETLSGKNTYTNATQIDLGATLALKGTGSIASSLDASFLNGGTLDISQTTGGASVGGLFGNSNSSVVALGGQTLTILNGAGPFAGTITDGGIGGGSGGALTIAKNASQTLSGNNTYTGATTIQTGATAQVTGGTIASSSGVNLTGRGATFDISSTAGNNQTIQDLAGVAGSTVALGGNALTLGTGNSTTVAGTIQDGGLDGGTGGSIVKQGSGALTLTGNNTYTGGTTLSVGIVQAGSATALGTGTLTFNGGTLQAGLGTLTIANNGAVNTAGGTIDAHGDSLTLSGTIANGSGSPPGALAIVSGTAGGTVTLTGANTYTGATTIASGATLALSGTGGIANSSGVADSGTFDVSQTNSSATVTTLSGAGSVALGAKALTISNGSTTFSGVIADGGIGGGTGGSLAVGGGTQTLTGSNTYTGATAITTGTLAIGPGGSIASSSGVELAGSTATFSISGAGSQTIQDLTGVAGSTVNLGTSSDALTAGTAASTVFAGTLTGAGSLAKAGSGALTLTGNNTYTSTTSITQGTLSIGPGGSIASSALVGLSGGTTFDISAGGNQTIQDLTGIAGSQINLGGNALTLGTSNNSSYEGGVVGAGGSLIKNGSGSLLLSGTNTYTGGTTVNAGTLAGNGIQAFGTGTLTLGAGTTLQAAAAGLSGINLSVSNNISLGGSTTFDSQTGALGVSGVISGSGSLAKVGSGALTLTGVNTYTGATTVSVGTLALSGTGGIATSSGVADAGTFDISQTSSGATITTLSGAGSVALGGQTLTLSNASTTFSGSIADGGIGGGTGGRLTLGGGTLTLSGANTYTGGTTVNAGTLAGNGTQAFGTGPLTLGSGTTLEAAAAGLGGIALSVSNNISLGGGTTFDSQTGSLGVGGVISGAGSLAKVGSGTLTLTGVNTYTGATTIGAGTLALSGKGSIAASSGVADSSTFDISQTSSGATITTLSGGGAVALGGQTLTISNASTTFSGSIADGGIGGGSGGRLTLGGGTLTLSGANTYTGTTTINGGTLALSGGGAIGTSAVNLAAGGTTLDVSAATSPVIGNLTGVGGSTVNLGGTTLAINQIGTSTFAGSFVGNNSSDVFLQGGGTEILTGANPHMTGAFFIDDGKLAIGPGGSVSQAVGGVTINGGAATFDIANGGNQTVQNLGGIGTGSVMLGANTLTLINTTANLLPAIISGTGGLVIEAPSTLTLSGANTYTGSTTVAAGGTLLIGGGGSIASSSSLTLDAGATFDIGSAGGGNQTVNNLSGPAGSQVALGPFNLTENSTVSTEFDGTISGSTPVNGLIKTGAATLTLSGVETYIGPTLIEGGTLALAGSGSLASSSEIDLTTAGATFDISNLARITVGTASGTLNAAAVSGSSVITIGSTCCSTVIQDLIGVPGTTVSLGTTALTFGTSDSTVFAGVFTGSGALTKQGSGTLTLDGNSSGYTGSTTITAGTLEVGDINNPGAPLGGNVTVDAGGTLGGHGSILGGVTNNAGTVSPGGTIGTMTIAGGYTQGAGGTLSIEVSPTAASQLKVGGAAKLDGTLALVFDPGIYSATSYKLLTASGVSGTFSTVTGANPSGLPQALLYDPTDVTLQLTGKARTIVVAPTNDTIYTAVTSTAILTAQQVNGIILDRLGARAAGIADGQVAAAPAGPARVQVAQAGPAGPLGDIAAALPGALASQGAWFRGVGGFASVNGNSSAPGFTGSTGGFLAGYDRPVGPNVYLGVASGYLHSGINEHSTSTGSEDSARFSVYGGMLVGGDLLSGTAGYAHDWFNTQRGFTGIGTASANYGGDEVTAAGQWSRPLSVGGLNGGTATLTPKAGLQYLHLSAGAFSELGAGGLDLSSGGKGTDSLQPYVQVALSQKFTTGNGTVVAPELRLGYAYEALDSRVLTVTTASGTAFPVTGVAPSRNQLSAGIGLVMEAAPDLSVYADYDTLLHTGNTGEQTVQAGLRFKF